MSASSYYRLLQASGVNKDTFYPAGTKCYVDPSRSSCFLFGNSGSGVLRKFTPDKYAFTGPLSMSKSCDQIWIVDKQITYSAENPGIFTDAYCYLPWIAGMYGMKIVRKSAILNFFKIPKVQTTLAFHQGSLMQ